MVGGWWGGGGGGVGGFVGGRGVQMKPQIFGRVWSPFWVAQVGVFRQCEACMRKWPNFSRGRFLLAHGLEGVADHGLGCESPKVHNWKLHPWRLDQLRRSVGVDHPCCCFVNSSPLNTRFFQGPLTLF